MAEMTSLEQEALRRALEMRGSQSSQNRTNMVGNSSGLYSRNNQHNQTSGENTPRNNQGSSAPARQQQERVHNPSPDAHQREPNFSQPQTTPPPQGTPAPGNTQQPAKGQGLFQNEQQDTGFKLPIAGELLDSLLQDKEKILILMLILILSSEEGDTGTILALMYLII